MLYRDALSNNRVDAIVGWHQAGGNLATLLASRYGCPALQATAVPTSTAPTDAPVVRRPPAGARRRRRQRLDAPTPTAPSRPPEPGALVQAPSNLTGICDRSLQSNIDAALNGTKNINDVITAVEPRLWNMSTVLPILQDTTIVGAGPECAERQPLRRGAGRHRRRRRSMGENRTLDRVRAAASEARGGITVSTMRASSRRFGGSPVSRKWWLINAGPMRAVSGVIVAGSISPSLDRGFQDRVDDLQARGHHGVGEDDAHFGFVQELMDGVQAGKQRSCRPTRHGAR